MSEKMSIADRIKMMQNQAAENSKPVDTTPRPEPKRLSVNAFTIPMPGLATPRSFGSSSGTSTPLGSGSLPMFTPKSSNYTTFPSNGSTLNTSNMVAPNEDNKESNTSRDEEANPAPRRGSVIALGRSLNIPLGGASPFGASSPFGGGTPYSRSRNGTLTNPLNVLPEDGQAKLDTDASNAPQLSINPDAAEPPKINHYRRATLSTKNRRRASTVRGLNMDGSFGTSDDSLSLSRENSDSSTLSTPVGSRSHSRRVSVANFGEFTMPPNIRPPTEFTFDEDVNSQKNGVEVPSSSGPLIETEDENIIADTTYSEKSEICDGIKKENEAEVETGGEVVDALKKKDVDIDNKRSKETEITDNINQGAQSDNNSIKGIESSSSESDKIVIDSGNDKDTEAVGGSEYTNDAKKLENEHTKVDTNETLSVVAVEVDTSSNVEVEQEGVQKQEGHENGHIAEQTAESIVIVEPKTVIKTPHNEESVSLLESNNIEVEQLSKVIESDVVQDEPDNVGAEASKVKPEEVEVDTGNQRTLDEIPSETDIEAKINV